MPSGNIDKLQKPTFTHNSQKFIFEKTKYRILYAVGIYQIYHNYSFYYFLFQNYYKLLIIIYFRIILF